MNSEQNDAELSQLWQEIETEPSASAQEVAKLARRTMLTTMLKLIWDILGCLILLFGLWYLTFVKQSSTVMIVWMMFATVLGVWLTVQFHKYRVSGQQALFGATANYQTYLRDKAKADINIGRLFNRSNALVTVTMFFVFAYEQWFSANPIISEPQGWWFLIGWSTVWLGGLFYYGYRKIRKAKEVLAQLSELD